MSSKVNFGLIGVGGISQAQHLPNLTRAKNILLKGVCDLDADLMVRMQREYNVPEVYHSVDEMLADSDIEAVVIATRPDSHVELTIAALQAGKHVYVEKPLAETVEECNQIIEAQQQSGKLVAVGFNRRMAPAYLRAKTIMQAHGGPKNMYYRISDAYHHWGNNEPGVRVLHELCHIFDIMRYLSGSEITSVYSVCSRPDDDQIVLTFDSGCVASIMASGYVFFDMPKESLEAVVDFGALTVTDFVELRAFGLDDCAEVERFKGHIHPKHDTTHRYLFERQGTPALLDIRKQWYKTYFQYEKLKKEKKCSQEFLDIEKEFLHHMPRVNYMVDKGWLQTLEHFADAIAGNTKLQLATPTDGLKATQIAQAVIESRHSHQPVKLPSHSGMFCSQRVLDEGIAEAMKWQSP